MRYLLISLSVIVLTVISCFFTIELPHKLRIKRKYLKYEKEIVG